MKKLLVANRSEIATRCFRSATELGLRTVAIYSFEDRFSLHRFKADEAFVVGPAEGGEPVRSYLNIDAIIAVAKQANVDAIHPGYGFLSENAAFARACAAAGIQFVGPTPEHIDTFGDKTAAKRLARSVGVPTIPGTEQALQRADDVAATAGRIGYPLMIKASFGGGGRGMRIVYGPDELAAKLEEAQREAAAAFGHADVFLERYIRHAKHIEVQVLGDAHGNLVHLWERDCSVQRRHQKVVEVAPSITLSDDLRTRICDAAVRLCGAVRYRSAGTVPAGAHTAAARDRGPRRRDAVPDHDGRSGSSFHPRLRADHDVPIGGRLCRPPRRRQWVRRLGDHAVFRLAAREGHDLGLDARRGGTARQPRAARVPHPWRENEHRVSPKSHRPSDVQIRPGDNHVH